MSVQQEELMVRMGLDTRAFEQRLRESARIADQYARKQGAALNLGPMNGGVPQSWSSLSNLSRQSQDLIRGTKGVNEAFAGLAGTLARFVGVGSILGSMVAGFKAVRGAMQDAWELARQSEILGTSSSFLLAFGNAASRAGENAQDATYRLAKVVNLIGQAQAGDASAQGLLKHLGVTPYGKTMDRAIKDIAEAFNRIKDPAERARLAIETFGRGGQTMLPVLKQINVALSSGVRQADLDVLAAAERGVKRNVGIAKEQIRDSLKIALASLFRAFGVKGEHVEPEKILRPDQTAEGQAKIAEEAAKKAHEAEVKNAKEQEAVHKHIAEYNKLENAKLETRLKLLEAVKKRTEDIANINRSTADRSGWTVADLAKQPLQYNRKGFAIIPEQLYSAATRFLGRQMTREELDQASRNYEAFVKHAQGAQGAADAAHAFRVLLPGLAGSATGRELAWRGANGALTSDEQNPLRQMQEHLQSVRNDISELARQARAQGLRIQIPDE
jgi:hypothetical protein